MGPIKERPDCKQQFLIPFKKCPYFLCFAAFVIALTLKCDSIILIRKFMNSFLVLSIIHYINLISCVGHMFYENDLNLILLVMEFQI